MACQLGPLPGPRPMTLTVIDPAASPLTPLPGVPATPRLCCLGGGCMRDCLAGDFRVTTAHLVPTGNLTGLSSLDSHCVGPGVGGSVSPVRTSVPLHLLLLVLVKAVSLRRVPGCCPPLHLCIQSCFNLKTFLFPPCLGSNPDSSCKLCDHRELTCPLCASSILCKMNMVTICLLKCCR